jgi:hypothetical protein
MVTGTTQHRLDLVRSYDPTQPYIVGTYGPNSERSVNNVTYDGNGKVESVNYTIDGITYNTILTTNLTKTVNGKKVRSINQPISSTRSYNPSNGTSVNDEVYPTTFSYTPDPTPFKEDNEEKYFVFKDDVKMGVVFTPKVSEEVFIERQKIPVFESQARLSDITSLEGLENYNNGFYNIVKTE